MADLDGLGGVELTDKDRLSLKKERSRLRRQLYGPTLASMLVLFEILQTIALKDWPAGRSLLVLAAVMIFAIPVAAVRALNKLTPQGRTILGAASFQASRNALREGDYETALGHATDSVNVNSSDAQAWNLLGRVQLRLGKFAEAESSFGRAIDENRQDDMRSLYTVNRGTAKLLQGHHVQARTDFDYSLSVVPRDVACRRWRALASYYIGDFEQAVLDATETVHLPPSLANWAVLSIVASAANQPDIARSAKKEAEKHLPKSPTDYYYVGALRGLDGDSSEAVRLLNIAIDADSAMLPRAKSDPLWRGVVEFPHG